MKRISKKKCSSCHCHGNIATETLLEKQMFPSVAAQGTFVTGTNFAAKKQESVPQF